MSIASLVMPVAPAWRLPGRAQYDRFVLSCLLVFTSHTATDAEARLLAPVLTALCVIRPPRLACRHYRVHTSCAHRYRRRCSAARRLLAEVPLPPPVLDRSMTVGDSSSVPEGTLVLTSSCGNHFRLMLAATCATPAVCAPVVISDRAFRAMLMFDRYPRDVGHRPRCWRPPICTLPLSAVLHRPMRHSCRRAVGGPAAPSRATLRAVAAVGALTSPRTEVNAARARMLLTALARNRSVTVGSSSSSLILAAPYVVPATLARRLLGVPQLARRTVDQNCQ